MSLTSIWLCCLYVSIALSAEIQEAPSLENPDMDPTHFLLYTRKNVNNSIEIDLNNSSSLAGTNFDITKPTKILVHGWRSRPGHKPFPKSIKDAYLEAMDLNVIIFDWSKIAHYNYIFAKDSIPIMASIIAGGIEGLLLAGVKIQDIHLIGHSLGAHIVGAVGQVGIYKPVRVTGLDPAGPLFGYNSEYRISNSSADFVDIIHTCGLVKGFFDPLGTVDFYPNGGHFPQTGCGLDIFDLGKCSHERAPYLFAQSILKDDSFLATQCDSWKDYKRGHCKSDPVIMGEWCPTSISGLYYLYTSGSAPYTITAES